MLKRILGVVLVAHLVLSPVSVASASEGGAVDLDLSSTSRSVSAGQDRQFESAEINVAGATRTVLPGDLLTPAEHVALLQVLSQGTQTLQLGPQGNAVGGSFSLVPDMTAQLANLVVPSQVTAIHDFAASSVLNLAGNLNNAGNFYALSSSSSVAQGTISAASIFNQQGALISSVLPAALSGMAASGVLDLNLVALQDIVNAGAITSSGNLAMTAGGAIVNALPAGAAGPAAIIQAVGNLNLQAASVINEGIMASQLASVNAVTAALRNSGTIEALSGGVAVLNALGSTLKVDNMLGAISARDRVLFETLAAAPGDKASILVSGGLLAAEGIDLRSPDGLVEVHVDRIDGGVDVAGGIAAIGTATGDLRIDAMLLTGDPIYYAQGGDLDLTGLFSSGSTFSTFGGDFVGLATGNITATPSSASVIDASNTSAPGGKLTLASGVNFTVSGGSSPITCSNCSGLFSITGTSASGGNIDMPLVSLRTNTAAVSVQARAGSTNSGTVSLGDIASAGAGGGCAGCSGSAGGTISVTGAGNVQTGYLRSFGGGGAGGRNGSGGIGGAGASITVSSSSGSVTVLGDINSSGGGGGGGSGSGVGGNGGGAGGVNISASTAISVAGPILSVAGGRGGNASNHAGGGGGSFGGGGGGGASTTTAMGQYVAGNGGGGLFGGGGGGAGDDSTDFGVFGQAGLGGGIFGGGAGGAGATGSAPAGTSGGGGSGGTGGRNSGQANIGEGGASSNAAGGDVGVSGAGSGLVFLSANTIDVSKSVATGLGFSGTYSGVSAAGGNTTFTASGSGASVSLSGALASAGGTATINSPSTTMGGLTYLGQTGAGTAWNVSVNTSVSDTSTGNVTLVRAPSKLNIVSPGNLSIGSMSAAPATAVNLVSGGNLSLASGGINTSSAAGGGQVNLAAGVNYTLNQLNSTVSISGPSTKGGSVSASGVNVTANGAAVAVQSHSGTSSSGTLVVGGIDTSGLSGTCDGCTGGNAGAISVTSSGNLESGSLRASGGDGAAHPSGNGGNGGNGAAITVTSSAGNATIGGDLDASGGSGGAGSTGNGADGTPGTVAASAAGAVVVATFNSPVTLAGSASSTMTSTGGGGNVVVVAGNNNPINFNSSFTYSTGASAAVIFSGGTLTFADGTTQTAAGGGAFVIEARTLNLGAGATVHGSKTSGTALTVYRYYEPMTVNLPQGSSATLSTGGGAMEVFADSITFNPGSGAAGLNLSGQATLKANGGNLTVDSGVTIASDSNLNLQIYGGNSFINSGVVTTSASSGVISVSGSNLTVGGANGLVSVTGGGSAYISILGYDAGLTLSSSMEFNAGSGGLVQFGPCCADLTIANGAALNVTGGSQVLVVARNLNFSDGASITSDRTSGTAIQVVSPFTPLNLLAPDGATVTMSTQGGAIEIVPQSGSSLTIGQSGNSATFDFSGGPLTLSVGIGHIVVNAGTTVSSEETLTISTNGYFGTITNNGSISSDAGILVTSPYDLTLAGSGSITTTNGNIDIWAGSNALSVTHSVQANEGDLEIRNWDSFGGTIAIGQGSFLKAYTASKATGLGQTTVVIGTGAANKTNTTNPDPTNISVTTSGGGNVYFGANGITALGSGNSLQAIAADLTFDSGSRPGSAITLGGSTTVIADPPVAAGSAEQRAPVETGGDLTIGRVSGHSQPLQELVRGAAVPNAMPLAIETARWFDSRLGVPASSRQDAGVPSAAWLQAPLLDSVEIDFRRHISGHGLGVEATSGETAGSRFNSPSEAEPVSDSRLSGSELVPIGFGVPRAASLDASQDRSLLTQQLGDAVIRSLAGSRVSTGESGLELHYGEMLVEARADLTVVCGDARVTCPKGTLALVTRRGDVLIVRNLHETKGQAVRLGTARGVVRVAAGEEVVVAADEAALREITSRALVGRRRVRLATMGASHIAHSEFSLVGLLGAHPLLCSLSSSKEAGDRACMRKMERMAACLMTVTASRGAYTERPR